jgi:cytochrome P450
MWGLSAVARRTGSLLTRRALRSIDLSTLQEVPTPLQFPLQRDGLDPVDQLGRARESGPIYLLASVFGLRVWMVTGVAENRAVLADSEHFSTDIRKYVGKQDATGAQAIGGLGFTDPPDHTRLRRLLTPEFTRRRLTRLQPRIDAIVAERLEALEAHAARGGSGEPVDLVGEFAFPIPFQVICELLGVAPEDRDYFRQLGHARFDVRQGGLGVFGAMSESRDFLIETARRQRDEPRDGLIGALIAEHGDAITDDELGGLADGIFTGGYETSASMIALGALTLIESPDAARWLREDEAAAAPVVEELLRYLSVVQIAFPRFAREDMDKFGVRLRAGDVVICSLSGANRDDALAEDDAELFNPGRHAGRPLTSHLAFGYGMHRCVGAELGRMELLTAIPNLVRRFPDMRLAVPANELEFRDLSIVYGIDALPVELGPASRQYT